MGTLIAFKQMLETLLGWPLIFYVLGISIVCTIACKFVQFRYFFKAWQLTLFPKKEKAVAKKDVDMTPLQAFVNTLSANLGNGSVAGMATAIYSGGPGAAFWVVLIGLLLMSVRFAEVFLSIRFSMDYPTSNVAGPMLYLKSAPGGKVLSLIYGILCLFFGFIVGNAMQTNSIRVSLATTFGTQPLVVATVLGLFILYVVYGGAARIVKVSDKLVPVKVIVFFASSLLILCYHYASIGAALKLIVDSAFTPVAATGGVLGFAVQQAMRFGISRSIVATESGLGTAAILYGSTGSTQPVKDGTMSILSTFISTLVCFIIALCIVASGVWSSGLTSTALTIASYNTVFGQFGGWLVSFLSVSFGAGVLVAYAYIAREAWLFVTGGKFAGVFSLLYPLVSFCGALVSVDALFFSVDVVNGAMLIINLFGLVCLLPMVAKGVQSYMQKNK